jgi:serine/threonine protein kinase
MYGGEVIVNGGSGCIFKPQIQCRGQPANATGPEKISKLMVKAYAQEEHRQILQIREQLKQNFPNYKKYFIIDDIDYCQPVAMTSSDLKDFDEMCGSIKSFKKLKITQSNVNDHRDKLRLLNVPHGGDDLFAIFESIFEDSHSPYNLLAIHSHLVDLYANAIIPLNAKFICHCDIKAANIVYNLKTDEMKLIDWGQAISGKRSMADFGEIPNRFQKYTSFHLNMPFGVVLLSPFFAEKYERFLLTYPIVTEKPSKRQNPIRIALIKRFLLEFIYECLNFENNQGDIDQINLVFSKIRQSPIDVNQSATYFDMSIIDNPDEYSITLEHDDDKYFIYDRTIYLIVNHLFMIINNWGHQDESREWHVFEPMKYFAGRFYHDIDTWGFLSNYMQIVMSSSDNNNQILEMIWYLYNPLYAHDRPINKEHVLDELLSITNAMKKSRKVSFL